MDFRTSLKNYYYLTKPGIIYGNIIMVIAGFLLASRKHVLFELLFFTITGISFVIGSACVFNNYMDREIDAKMNRTKHRALPEGNVSGRSALIFACLLGLTGFLLLAYETNLTTLNLGLIGFIDYVILYAISKRRLSQGTLVGSISGAIPPAAGYTAVTGHFDKVAIILFFIMVFWQMPHFYAISIYRRKDYKAAGIPVLSVKKNISVVKRRIMYYVVAFTISTSLLTLFKVTNYVFMAVALFIGMSWLAKGLITYNKTTNKMWAKGMFLYSLIVICCMGLLISMNGLLS